MRLSVCLIAKNEEHNLPRALKSVAGVADEIIVTDTGSEDDTIQIARDLGALVHHFAWSDDFAAARNHCVSQAKGEWIFWIDADEELLPSSEGELLQCIENKDALAYFVSRQDLVDTARLDHFAQMWQMRLFRNRTDLQFQGRCHPDFIPPIKEIALKENLHIETTNIALRHYGYIGELRREKLLRGARLLELELQDRPNQLYYLIEYGRSLLLLNDPKAREVLAQATEQILPHMEKETAPIPLVAALLEYLLQLPNKKLPKNLTRNEVQKLAKRWFPNGAPLLWIMAQQAFAQEDYEQAEAALNTLALMGRDNSYDQHISFDPRIVHEDARLNLGVCLVRQAKLKEAERCFSELIKDGHCLKEAKANLKVIKRLRIKYRGHSKKRKKPKRRKRRS